MTDTERDTRSVFERVHSVLADMPAIGKDNRAPEAMGGYPFRGIEDITAELKPLLAKHGVFMAPTVVERRESTRTTGNNKSLYVVDLLVRFTFYATDGPVYFDATVWGQGSDSGDKATQKAMTSAFKSMLAITFCISDSESDAERHHVPDTYAGPPRATREDRDAIAAALKQIDDGELRASVVAELHENWGPSNELLATNVDDVLQHIESARANALPFDAGRDGQRSLDDVEPDEPNVIDVGTTHEALAPPS